jgi:hypothetical protein
MDERDSNHAIEHALREWDGVNAGPAHGVLVRAAKEALAARRAQSASAERIRDAVRAAWAEVARLSGYRFPERVVEDVAGRVASQLLIAPERVRIVVREIAWDEIQKMLGRGGVADAACAIADRVASELAARA